MRILLLNNNPTKFHPDPIPNYGALITPAEKQEEQDAYQRPSLVHALKSKRVLKKIIHHTASCFSRVRKKIKLENCTARVFGFTLLLF